MVNLLIDLGFVKMDNELNEMWQMKPGTKMQYLILVVYYDYKLHIYLNILDSTPINPTVSSLFLINRW